MNENRYIELSNICKSFDGKAVLTNFNHRFEIGKTGIIMGKSGIGKTSLINIMLGLCKADSGSIKNMPERIGVVFQEDRLCEEFSIEAAITMVMDKYAIEQCGFAKVSEYVEDLLDRLKLKLSAKKKISELSGGEKRRVAIGRALAYFPELYIFDEAFKGLDEGTKREVIEVVKVETKGKTLIMISHDRKEAALFEGEIREI